MPQEMTMEEIEAQFANEWVLVGDPQLNEFLEVVRGTVLCHSADRDEFDRAVPESRKSEIRSSPIFTPAKFQKAWQFCYGLLL